jgi:hypothetical protein
MWQSEQIERIKGAYWKRSSRRRLHWSTQGKYSSLSPLDTWDIALRGTVLVGAAPGTPLGTPRSMRKGAAIMTLRRNTAGEGAGLRSSNGRGLMPGEGSSLRTVITLVELLDIFGQLLTMPTEVFPEPQLCFVLPICWIHLRVLWILHCLLKVRKVLKYKSSDAHCSG